MLTAVIISDTNHNPISNNGKRSRSAWPKDSHISGKAVSVLLTDWLIATITNIGVAQMSSAHMSRRRRRKKMADVLLDRTR
jgi:hypothetical protein